MPTVPLKDVQLHYQFAGPDRAPVLLFSNSLGTNFAMWDPQMPELSRAFRILRYDMRGHGRSQVPPGPYTIPQLAADVIHLLDALSVDKVDFCGLSMSGMIGMELAFHAPHRLRNVIICNTAPKLGTPAAWNTRIQNVQTGGMKSIADAVIERWFTPEFRASAPAPVESTRQMLLRTPPEGYAASCAAVRDMDATDTIFDIKVPTLVIHGTRDPVTAPDDGEKMAAAIPGAQLANLPAAHLSNIEAASAFTMAVAKFLQA
jgi:3-oxoadipate enol-lactonase